MYKNDRQTASKCKTFVLGFYGYNISAAFSAMTIIIATFTFTGFFSFCFVFIHFTDKQKIENETKKQMQRDSTIEVLEEQLKLWTAKVNWIYSIEL